MFNTPVDERSGIKWAFISGVSNVAMLALGFVLLVNRELVAQKMLPMYEIETEHPLLRPWIRLTN